MRNGEYLAGARLILCGFLAFGSNFALAEGTTGISGTASPRADLGRVLFAAADSGNLHILKRVVQQVGDPLLFPINATYRVEKSNYRREKEKRKPLWYAAHRGDIDAVDFFLETFPHIHLNQRAGPDATTPLMEAIDKGRPDVTLRLLNHADSPPFNNLHSLSTMSNTINAFDNDGWGALDYLWRQIRRWPHDANDWIPIFKRVLMQPELKARKPSYYKTMLVQATDMRFIPDDILDILEERAQWQHDDSPSDPKPAGSKKPAALSRICGKLLSRLLG